MRPRRRRAATAQHRPAHDDVEAGESLGQGASGVRAETIAFLETMLAHDIIPVVPAQGSSAHREILAPLAHMTAAMLGVGDVFTRKGRLPAVEGLALAGLQPFSLGPKEGLALLNGTQFSTAVALAAPRRSQIQTALIVGALTTDAALGSDTPFDPRIHRLRKHRGQIEAADALRNLMASSALRASHLVNDERVQASVLSALPASSDGRLSGSVYRRPRSSTPRPTVFPTIRWCSPPKPGLNSGFMIPQVTAAALVSEKQAYKYFPASVDSDSHVGHQEDHVSMAALRCASICCR